MTSADREVDVEDDWPGGWFGESWEAPVCEVSRHRPTPIGASCMYCDDAITEDDQGLLIPGSKAGPNDSVIFVLEATHLGCFLYQIGASVMGMYCEYCRGFHGVEEDCDP